MNPLQGVKVSFVKLDRGYDALRVESYEERNSWFSKACAHFKGMDRISSTHPKGGVMQVSKGEILEEKVSTFDECGNTSILKDLVVRNYDMLQH